MYEWRDLNEYRQRCGGCGGWRCRWAGWWRDACLCGAARARGLRKLEKIRGTHSDYARFAFYTMYTKPFYSAFFFFARSLNVLSLFTMFIYYLLFYFDFMFISYFVSVKHSWTYEQKDEGNQIILSSLCYYYFFTICFLFIFDLYSISILFIFLFIFKFIF